MLELYREYLHKYNAGFVCNIFNIHLICCIFSKNPFGSNELKFIMWGIL